MMGKHNSIKNPALNKILEIDKTIKEETKEIIENKMEITK